MAVTDQAVAKNSEDDVLSTRLVTTAFVLFVMSSVAFIFSRTICECLWEHVKVGQQFLAAGGVVTVDPWSYLTAGWHWLSYNSLFEVMLGAVYNAAGVTGLTVLKLALVLALTGILYARLLRSGLPVVPASLVLTLALLGLGPLLFGLRPHLLTALWFTLMLLIFDKAANGRRQWLLALPVLMAVWTNSHGGFVSGLAMIAIWCAGDVGQQLLATRKPLAVLISRQTLGDAGLFGASLLATVLNPYGPKLPLFLAAALRVPRDEIPDWHPISLSHPLGLMYVGWVLAAIFILARSKKEKPLSSIFVLIAATVLPISAIRHILLFIITMVVVLAPHLADVYERYCGSVGNLRNISKPGRLFLSAVFFVLSGVMLVQGAPALTSIPLPADLPIEAVALLEKSGISGNLATSFDWGDYCVWHLNPRMKVSFDGRREVAYPPKALGLNMKFTYGLQDWDELLDKYPTDVVMVSPNYAVYNLMRLKSGWQMVYHDPNCGIFMRTGSPLIDKFEAAVKATPVRFAGAGGTLPDVGSARHFFP